MDLRHPEVKKLSGVEDTTPDNVEDILETAVLIGGVSSFLPLYVPILIRFFNNTFSLQAAIITLLGVESIAFIVLLYAAWKIASGRFWEERKVVNKLRAEGKIKSVFD